MTQKRKQYNMQFKFKVALEAAKEGKTVNQSSTLKIKWWVNIGVLIVGPFLIWMSYLEHLDPIGVSSIEKLWVVGIIATLIGIYWLIQRVFARLQT